MLRRAAMWLALALGLHLPDTALADPEMTLRYGEREVDLAPYFFAYPYNIETISFRAGKVYFSHFEAGGARRLYVKDWNARGSLALSIEGAQPVTGLDLNTINFWGASYLRQLDALLVLGSPDKAEMINLWHFATGSAPPRQLTFADYVYAVALTDDQDHAYFTARYGDGDRARGCLERLDLTDGAAPVVEQLVCDDAPGFVGKLRSWAMLKPDGERVYFVGLADGRRDDYLLYRHDRSTGETTVIAEMPDAPFFWTISQLGGDGRLFLVNDRELMLFEESTGQIRVLETFEQSILNVERITDGTEPYLAVILDGVLENRIFYFRFDGTDLIPTGQETYEESIGLATDRSPEFLFSSSSIDQFWQAEIRRIADGQIKTRFPFIEGLDDINERLRHCRSEKVTFTYHDTTSAEDIEVSGFLLQPRDPVPANERLFVIDAFYGGGNWFEMSDQLFCGAGITVFTPTVRGDNRLTPAYEQANDGANADAPVRDVIAAARYLQERFALDTPRRIGLKGFSHGGWAALRALTWPGDNGFDFGFALAGAGYYDLPAIADPSDGAKTNIPGWIVKEFGDPKTDADQLRWLSPAAHLERLSAPVFLYHGADDSRIAVDMSRAFARDLDAAGKEFVLLVVPDQGHGISGPDASFLVYQAQFNFLAKIRDGLKD